MKVIICAKDNEKCNLEKSRRKGCRYIGIGEWQGKCNQRKLIDTRLTKKHRARERKPEKDGDPPVASSVAVGNR